MRLGKHTIILLLLTFSLLTNAKIVAHFRLVDIVILASILIVLRDIVLTRVEMMLISVFALIISLTSFFNLQSGPRVHEFVFYYKYFFFFIVLILVRNLTQVNQSKLNVFKKGKRLRPILLIRFLGIYFILNNLYFFLNNSFTSVTGASRVSIPFSTLDVGTSNAPAYSIILFAIAIYLDRYGKSQLDLVIMLCLIVSALLAGSRSGLVIFSLYILLYRRPVFDIKSLSVLFICVIGISLYGEKIGGIFLELVSRTFEFNLIADTSANDRLFKQLLAVEMTLENSAMLFGIGHENTTITWYDGMIGNLLIIGGAPGLIIFSMLIYVTCKSIDAEPRMFLILFTAVSLISEFILTSYVCGILLLLILCAKENNDAVRSV